jgi:L-aminopeptidase/D-esterase-like protein
VRSHNRPPCPPSPAPPSFHPSGAITDVAGIEVGHFTDTRRPTGCTVIMAREGAVAGVDVRGAAPGTRETDLLAPGNLVQQVHAVMLAGGSAWGLAAAEGAMRWLEERDIGMDVRFGTLPIVPAAVLFDLPMGDARIRPDAASGYAACDAASTGARRRQRGRRQRRAGGQALRRAPRDEGRRRHRVGHGRRRDGGRADRGQLAGRRDRPQHRAARGRRAHRRRHALLDTRRALLRGEPAQALLAGTNTTIGVIATDAVLTKVQANRLATVAHDGLARAINPVHTMSDGDTLFALATGRVPLEGNAPRA